MKAADESPPLFAHQGAFDMTRFIDKVKVHLKAGMAAGQRRL
jgi:hypothetical protein